MKINSIVESEVKIGQRLILDVTEIEMFSLPRD